MRRTLLLVMLVAVPMGAAVAGVHVLRYWLRATSPVPHRMSERRAYDWKALASGRTDAETAPVSLIPIDAPDDNDLTVPRKIPKNVNLGTTFAGTGTPSNEPGSWSQFRGDALTNVAPPEEKLLRTWPPGGPEVLWERDLAIGYAGFAVRSGRVFIIDYDVEKQEDTVRCLSLDDGEEIWRYGYFVPIKNNHGITRTIPAANDDFVVTLGPKCHVSCLEAATGKRAWTMDLVEDQHSTVPDWNAGQCPIIDGDRVILAPGGDALMMAVQLSSGEALWRTPNPAPDATTRKGVRLWDMSHTSITPITYDGVKQYVYSSLAAIAGVRASDGKLLWQTSAWRVPTAAVASPVVIGADRILFSGGYNAGSAVFRLTGPGDAPGVERVFTRTPKEFSSDQQTPVFYNGRLYTTLQRSTQLVCMTTDGTRVWSSGPTKRFGLGPYLVADGLLLMLHEKGTLHLVETGGSAYSELARAKVLSGTHAWAPMALAGGKLLVRDQRHMKCLRVGTREP